MTIIVKLVAQTIYKSSHFSQRKLLAITMKLVARAIDWSIHKLPLLYTNNTFDNDSKVSCRIYLQITIFYTEKTFNNYSKVICLIQFQIAAFLHKGNAIIS